MTTLAEIFDHVEFVPEHLTRPRRGDDGIGCDHDWQPGADGAFAGLTEHCAKCGYER